MKMKRTTVLAAAGVGAVVWVFAAGRASATLVVDFDPATYGTGTLRGGNPTAQTLDLDNDGTADDCRTTRAFTDPGETSWSTDKSATGLYTGPTLYGGVVGEGINLKKQFDAYALTSFAIRWQTNGTDQSGRLHIAVVFAADSDGLSFDTGEGGTSSMTIANNGGDLSRFDFLGDARWLVRNDTTYYVSQTTIANNSAGRTLDATELANEMWAVYSPEDAFDFNLSLSFDTATSSLTDMNAFGLITYKEDFTAVRH